MDAVYTFRFHSNAYGCLCYLKSIILYNILVVTDIITDSSLNKIFARIRRHIGKTCFHIYRCNKLLTLVQHVFFLVTNPKKHIFAVICTLQLYCIVCIRHAVARKNIAFPILSGDDTVNTNGDLCKVNFFPFTVIFTIFDRIAIYYQVILAGSGCSILNAVVEPMPHL